MTRLLVLPVSPLNAPGLLTVAGWDALRSADRVVTSCAHPAWIAQLREAGVEAEQLDSSTADALTADLAAALQAAEAAQQQLVWLCDAEHPWLPQPMEIVRAADRDVHAGSAGSVGAVDVDFVFASPVAPGSAVVESVRIMHELRSAGGDPWSAEQTHRSLARYLVEEAYEVLEELEADHPNRQALVSELGDVLFQLVFHARIGMESPEPWTLDDVARALNQKMYRRNPHVFAAERSHLAVADVVEQWHAIKRTEQPRRGLGEGIAAGLPALQHAFKLVARAKDEHMSDQLAELLGKQRAAAEAEIALAADEQRPPSPDALTTLEALRLMDIVISAQERDADPESALRRLNRRLAQLGT